MQKLLGVVLGGMVVFVLLCGSAAAAEKDWYLALRLGYQPYDLDAEGTLAGRDIEYHSWAVPEAQPRSGESSEVLSDQALPAELTS